MLKTILLLSLFLTGCTTTLDKVNHQVNAHPYIAGEYDCKNYVIDKYYILKNMGYKDDEMQFVITSYDKKPHVVLNVNGWIMDNNYYDTYPADKDLRSGFSPDFWKKISFR